MTKHEKTHKTFIDRKKLFTYAGVSFILMLLVQVILYYVSFNSIPDFLKLYGPWIFYLDISVATIAACLWYYYSYKGFTSCMASMMIAMTFGMQTGMMIGAVFGAVNGFFIGAMIGMILGTIIGLITGRSNPSVMGVMQGAMSGVMGGTMGSMITFMMFSDNVLIFMPFYMIINVGILYGLAQMYYDEVIKDNNEVVKTEIGITEFSLIATVIGTIFTLIMIYAPKSVIFG
jgi:hypothetical protein